MAKFAFEGLNARMEGEDTADETTIDVDIKVADRTEEASSIVEEAATVAADADAADDVAEEIESLEHMRSVIQQHGIQPGVMALINRDNRLGLVSGRSLAAAESLNATGRNHSEAQAAMEAISDTIAKGWEAVKKFFRNLGDKLKTLWGKVLNYFTSWESGVRRAKESIASVTVDPKKAAEHKAKLVKVKDYEVLATHVTKVIDVLLQGKSNMKTKDAFANKATDAELKVIGLKREDGVLVSVEGAKVLDEMTVKASGWTVDFANDTGFKAASGIVEEIRGSKSLIKEIEAIAANGISAVETAMKMGDSSSKKEEIEILRKNASDFAKMMGKVSSRAAIVPRAYIAACGALRACRS